MKRLICILFAMMLLWGSAWAEEDTFVMEYTGECPHDIFDFEILLDEHQVIVEQMGWAPEGYSTGICEICEERFLLHPFDADYASVYNSTESCPHHYQKQPAVIREGWYIVGAAGHQYKTYHLAVCALCSAYIKYYNRPTGPAASPDMIAAHNWTHYSYHDKSIDVHFYVTVCTDCGMVGATEIPCWMYDNGMCSIELEEALEFYGK